ncbi:MAG: porin [Alphaproteobacteria bacterium]|nr:porin [Alphaproteobacteria bacterium]
MKRISLVAMMAVAGLFSTNAMAADLGGDCCADLEERVAELEATTARKGNRKVSLTIYGQVTTGVMFWDAEGNGIDESNTYVVDPQTSGTRFGFKGKASINSEWSAGYQIELQWQTADANKTTPGNSLTVDSDESLDAPEFRQAHWYIQSSRLGKIRVGQADTANSGIAEISVANELIADAMSSSHAGLGIIRNDLAGPAINNFEFNRQNVVRYDTPTMAGFVFSAAWGEDDLWDVALRYAGEFGGFKVAAGIAYGESTDSSNGIGGPDPAIEVVNGGASVMHMPTGLFVTVSAGQRDRDTFADEEVFWHLNAGIEQKWFALGKTTVFGMVSEYDDAVEASAQSWGLGVVQKIDAAAMDLFISYRSYELDNGAGVESDFDAVVGGGRIKF